MPKLASTLLSPMLTAARKRPVLLLGLNSYLLQLHQMLKRRLTKSNETTEFQKIIVIIYTYKNK